MPFQLQPGALVLAFDLGETAPSLGRAVPGPVEEMAEALLHMLDRRRLPATWAVSDPASCDFATRLIFNHGGHEIALRADPTWAGRGVGRPRLSSELCQRLNRARAKGCTLSSLLLSGVRLDQNLDLLVKHGLSSVIAGGAARDRVGVTARAHLPHEWPGRALYRRFGLWELEATARFPSWGDWVWRGAGVRPQTSIQGPLRPGLPVNLVAVNVAALVTKGARGLRLMDRVFRLAAPYRDARQQAVVTASELARRLSSPRQLLPARSILRTLAA